MILIGLILEWRIRPLSGFHIIILDDADGIHLVKMICPIHRYHHLYA